MASNELPRSQAKLWALAADMSDGFQAHDPGILQNTRAKLDDDLADAKATEAAFALAQQAEETALTARNSASSNAKAALFLTKRQLIDVPGAIDLIWPADTTEVPNDISKRLTLVEKTADYLAANPTQAVPAKNFTEAILRATHADLEAARSTLNRAVSARVDAKTARNAAEAALRKRLSALIKELASPGMFTPDDDRWYAFGLVPPAGIDRPGIAPDDVMLRLIAPGTVRAAWSDTPRAHRFRPFYKVNGRDADFLALPVEDDLDLLLENLPTTGVLKFYVIATNPAGDSPKSEVVEINLA
jgi:hypothetical protein